MIRRTVLALTALTVIGGFSGSALANDAATTGDDAGRHYVCLLGNETPNGPSKGVCVWIPTS